VLIWDGVGAPRDQGGWEYSLCGGGGGTVCVNLAVSANWLRRTHHNFSTPRLAELGDALDMRSVGASPALRLLHPGRLFRKFVVYTKGTVLGFLLKEY
jgi:hypothetical protein